MIALLITLILPSLAAFSVVISFTAMLADIRSVTRDF
jgi:hypothetical protein